MTQILPVILIVLSSLMSQQTNAQQKDKNKNEYLLSSGFIYHKENIAKDAVYEGGAWALYYYLEQNISVSAELRKFLKGNLQVLFRIGFDSNGEMVTISAEEKYNWYNIDAWGKGIVTEFSNAIREAPGWKKNFTGELFIPLKFKSSGGRIFIDYNSYTSNQSRVVRIGDK
jgi:hypothetical protein